MCVSLWRGIPGICWCASTHIVLQCLSPVCTFWSETFIGVKHTTPHPPPMLVGLAKRPVQVQRAMSTQFCQRFIEVPSNEGARRTAHLRLLQVCRATAFRSCVVPDSILFATESNWTISKAYLITQKTDTQGQHENLSKKHLVIPVGSSGSDGMFRHLHGCALDVYNCVCGLLCLLYCAVL